METLDSLQLSLDYSQKQVGAAQEEIVRLKKNISELRFLLRRANTMLSRAPIDSWGVRDALCEEIQDELAKE